MISTRRLFARFSAVLLSADATYPVAIRPSWIPGTGSKAYALALATRRRIPAATRARTATGPSISSYQNTVGHIGCDLTGTVPLGGACDQPALGPHPCGKGAECVAGTASEICDHRGRTPSCDTDHACISGPGCSIDETTTIAGFCEPACDPLTCSLNRRLIGVR